ncbi:Uncharacterised protein [Pseudomonas putida]|uniref:hypothetical protein n=1 Tax=Pseudomonas guariconensis TaxID=1288410 RepID=UPI001FA5EC35|nr:hypothetical protein [Pseudomonas guariconensis]CAB5525924.1 Uncharacterised protein [Pseudomonas putida]MDM9595323.1 hypothetical protein [Pseudomonas guariconensis]MDM9608153.1 hypothetical protein [Pseudomonas guariconensis]MDM9613110.1 hypothetical protein [Pseudomonas guariconensis]CAB5529905.1 Uncharacterised protein [Pseudomonas putida]
MNPLNLMRRVLGVTSADQQQPLVVSVPPPRAFPEAERIAASLRDYPGDWGWRMKGYELEHTPTGFVIWVANQDYGLAVVSSGHKAKFEVEEQQVIWPAVEAWLASRKTGFTGRLPKVKIVCQKGTWWCVGEGHPWAGIGGSPAEAYRSWARAVSIEARTDQRPGEILHVWSAAQ